MVQMADGSAYKTRIKPLTEFFRRSRDGWKQKCFTAKAELKKFKNRSQWLETSRDHWKVRAKELETELQCLREEQKTIRP